MDDTEDSELIRALHDPACFPHPVDSVEMHETHANWILLAGSHAYKIKKAVDFGFLDFSTLERRRHFCEEELRLNRRLAPELYSRVVPITGSAAQPRMDGPGKAIEYAVVMRRFDPAQRLDHRLERGELDRDALDLFAADIASFHKSLDGADADSAFGLPDALWSQASDNFRDCRAHAPADECERIDAIASASRTSFNQLRTLLERRRREGHVRECHGDLHLANLVFHDGRVRAFDCIEFNPELRWIDTASETAFLLMDLKFRQRADLAARWRNAYIECSGDHDSLPLLPFFEAYRAMVRAKVAFLTAAQASDDSAVATRKSDLARRYLQCAEHSLRTRQGGIVITRGLSGSGKSHVSMGLVESLPAIRLRSDVERKRLFGLDPLSDSHSTPDHGIYTRQATERTYTHLARLAETLATAGEIVIVDATFLNRGHRDLLRQAATAAGVPFHLLQMDAPESVLQQRIRDRAAAGGDASEADLQILQQQIAAEEVLGEDEMHACVRVDTTRAIDYPRLAARLRS